MSRQVLFLAQICAAVAVCAAVGAAYQAAAQAPRRKPPRGATKLAPPPVWDQAVIEKFFPDARQRLGAGPPPGERPPAAADEVVKDLAPPRAAAVPAGGAWSDLISAEALEDEIKAQVRPVSAAVQTQTGFKGGGYKIAREDFTLLAALFGVAGQYEKSVRWQRDAAGLREVFARVGMNCKVGTDSSFNEAKLRSQDLAELVRGGSVELRPAESEFEWPKVANRAPLMQRMEHALRERLGPWTASKAEFSKRREAIAHEGQMLAILARIIKADGYEYADDSSYREYVETLERQCQEIHSAAKEDDWEQAQRTAGQMNKTCDACHGDFRS